jgi:hypothetical protein
MTFISLSSYALTVRLTFLVGENGMTSYELRYVWHFAVYCFFFVVFFDPESMLPLTRVKMAGKHSAVQ